MAKTNITQYSATPSSNTDINSINIDENCPASGLNNAIRELMAHLKNVDTGSQALTSPSFTAMSTDTISEKTSANGVSIDSVTLKDGELGTTASPVAIHSSSLNGGQFGGRRNIIINGAMQVAQRGTSVSSVTSGGYKALDRYQVDYSGSHAWTISQDSNTPNGFGASMKFLCTTAQAVTGSQRIAFRQKIEGYNLQGTKKGTSDALSVTASFYVKSNKTGTYILEYYDIDNQRHINKAYTVDTADTWEYKTITFEADTTGSFDDDANASAQLHFWLGAGSTYTSGTLQSSWGTATTANRAVGNVNLADTVNNYWQVTGIQLEVGEQATPFEHTSFGEELQLCKRYYEKSFPYGTAPSNSSSASSFSTYQGIWWVDKSLNNGYKSSYRWDVEKRTTPSTTPYGNSSGYWYSPTSGWHDHNDTSHKSPVGFLPRQQASGSTIEVYGHYGVDAEL